MAEQIIKKGETCESVEKAENRRTYVPRVDIYEADENIYLVADLPGADDSSVDITVENDVLTICACASEDGLDPNRRTYGEYGTGEYYRAFTLSDEIDKEKIGASMKNGILTVALPKAESHKTRKIPIHAAAI